MSRTLVLDINELYRVVPEAQALEGKNFKDVRELLKDLISAIEKSGQWQFIQYVNNKPSLFVIREETAGTMDVSKLKSDLKNLILQVKRDAKTIQDAVPDGTILLASQPAYQPPKTEAAKEVYSDDKFDETAKEVSNLGESLPTTKLPWE